MDIRQVTETIAMIEEQNFDIRTITMGISLLDCIDPDIERAAEKIYQKITTKAANLVAVGDEIAAELGIPIVNKRVSVTPISLIGAATDTTDYLVLAKALDRAAKKIGVDFIGGFSALVQKGYQKGDEILINSIPRALAETDKVCSSVNIGSTKSGINMTAVADMGRIIKETAALSDMGAAKLVVFANAVEDNPFMAGAFHGVGEADVIINVGVSGPGVVKRALEKGKHVLCESPITLKVKETEELFQLAKEKNLVLMEAIKTAYSNAYNRLILLAKTGKIGKVVSVDATCTSIQNVDHQNLESSWNSISAWGPTAMLPIFQLFRGSYEKQIYSLFENAELKYDNFTKIDFFFQNATASIKVGRGVKSEGELVISGTKGYIYVPAPWWKTDYFELRFEDANENRRYFYPLEGEGIRNQLLDFSKAIVEGKKSPYLQNEISEKITAVLEDFYAEKDMKKILP